MMLASAGVYAFPPYYGGSPASNVIIDDFSAPNQSVLVSPFTTGTFTNQAATPPGVSIGDNRDLAVYQPTAVGNFTILSVFPSQMAMSQTTGSDATFYATWDGSNAVTTPTANQPGGGPGVNTHGLDDGIGLPGYDLTSNGINNGILIELLSVEAPANQITVSLEIFDYAGGSHTASYTYLGTDVPVYHFFTFEDFGYATGYDVQPGEGPINAGAIQMVMNGTPNSDGNFGAVLATQIPVPAPLALIGVGLLGLGATRRRPS